MNALTPAEIADLDRLESIVEKGEKTFVEVGLALMEIKDRRLYLRDYDTWEAYCQDRWGWTRQRSQQLISAAVVVQQLPTNLSTMVDNERTARELSKLPPEEQKKVVKEESKNGKVTSAAVRKHIPPPPPIQPASTKPAIPPPPPVKPAPKKDDGPRDKTGWVIPKKLLPLWERAGEIQAMLTQISHIKGVFDRAQEDKDPMFREVNFSSIKGNLEQAYADCKRALPFAVCTNCQGQATESCVLCKGRGLLSEFAFDKFVPRETKEIRFKNRK